MADETPPFHPFTGREQGGFLWIHLGSSYRNVLSHSTWLQRDESCREQKLEVVGNNWAASLSLPACRSSQTKYFRGLIREHNVIFQYFLSFPWKLLVSDLRVCNLK